MRHTSIDGHEIVNTGKDSEDRNVYRTKGDLFKVLTEPAPRRQFDVSKLPTRIHHASIYDEGKFDGEYFLKEKVLEAWNNGTIEELLKGWVGE